MECGRDQPVTNRTSHISYTHPQKFLFGELEIWLSGLEDLLPLQRTYVWLPETIRYLIMACGPVTPVAGDLRPSSGLLGLLHAHGTHELIQIHIHTHKINNKMLKLLKMLV